MKNLMLRTIIMAMFLGLAEYGVALPDAEKASMASMSVADLNAAADASRAQKDYRQAIQYLQAALRKDPANAPLFNKLGITQMQAGDLGSAASTFKKAIKVDPKLAVAYNNLGAVAYQRKKYGDAAREFKRALALEETNASFHINLGAAWFGQNQLERASAEYARAFELDPEVLGSSSRTGVEAILSPDERARYQYMLAKLYAKHGDVDRCLECLRKAKEAGYHDIANVYKDQEFAGLWQDARLAGVVPEPKKR